MVEEFTDSRDLTFSQAQGYEELPRQLALEEISQEARVRLWNLLVNSAWVISDFAILVKGDWRPILAAVHSHFFIRPIDEFSPDSNRTVESYKRAILNDLPFNNFFDLIQLIMRHPKCPIVFIRDVAEVFGQCRLAYVVDTQKPVTILPATTEHEGQVIIGAIHEFRAAGLKGTESHIRKAVELVSEGDWPGSVRESIHAVESVACLLDPSASKTLGPALSSLEKKGHLHPALKTAFGNLYGYSSDEEGIRHSLLTNATSQVGQDEALFMLGACASFASYLWRRHRTGSQI